MTRDDIEFMIYTGVLCDYNKISLDLAIFNDMSQYQTALNYSYILVIESNTSENWF